MTKPQSRASSKTSRQTTVDVWKVRRAFAAYIGSEGCSCCESTDRHNEAKASLAKILRVPKYSDGSGFDFDSRRLSPRKTKTNANKGKRK